MCCAFLLIRGICPCRRRRDPTPDCAMAQHHVMYSMMRALVFKPAAQRALRFASLVVLLVLAGVVAASVLITRNVVREQERLILHERTAEVAAVLGSAFTGVQSSLQLLGVIARSDQGHSRLFADSAHSVATPGTQAWLVITARPTGLRVAAAAGTGPAVGQAISGDRGKLARQALASKEMISGLVRDGPRVRLAFALGQAAGPGTVVWQESAISPASPVRSAPTSPWRSLNIALYVSDRPDPSALVLRTEKTCRREDFGTRSPSERGHG